MRLTTRSHRSVGRYGSKKYYATACALMASGIFMPAKAQILLEEIVIEGDASVVTEGKDTYTAERATVGGKQPQDIRDVPQTVTVVTQQRIEDSNATTIEEIANQVPGLTTALGDPWTGSIYARGQEVFQYYIDGAPRPFLSIYGTAPDLFFFDRVEVLSGPSGVYQGSGEPVGTLNLVRKRAEEEPGGSISGSYNTFDGYRGEFDVTGALNESGTVRARIAAYGEQEDSYIDIINSERKGLYGTLEFDVTPGTTISVGGIVEDNQNVRFSGLPTFTDGTLIDLPRETFIGAPWSNFETKNKEFFAELEHRFDYGGVLKISGRHYERDADIKSLLGSSAVDPVTGNFEMFTFARDFQEESSYLDANLTSPLDLFGKRGELVIGADYRFTSQKMLQKFGGFIVANVFDFDPNAIPEPDIVQGTAGPGGVDENLSADEYGLYTQGRLEVLPGLKINLGGRFAWYESDSINFINGETTDISEQEFIPYAGVTYDLTSQVTVYTSYSEIFQPQTELQAGGGNLEPRIGKQVEFGAKAYLFDDRIAAQASYFIINDENRAVGDPDNVGAFIAAGEAESKGFEITLLGSPIENVQFIAGYAYVTTDLESDPTPEHSFTAFAKYEFPESSSFHGFTVGAGVRAVSDFDIVTNGIEIEAPGYLVADAMIAYEFDETLGIQLNVNNVFDKTYVTRVNDVARGTFYGEPLNATLKLTKKF
ncbi:MAG: TonB-dependent siderophore receptor [Hyphomicrobiales bacterium]|nr:TonB-dependent siderophore receptor [Hyphomicrobiales bacterium]